MQKIDGTIIAQKAISAVMRTNEQLTLTSLNEVLRGVDRKNYEEAGFTKIKTFGAGREYSATQWRYFLIELLVLKVFTIDYDSNFVLRVAEFGYDIIEGKATVELTDCPSSSRAEASERKPREPRNMVVFNKVEYPIDPDIFGVFKWSDTLRKIRETFYWNYGGPQKMFFAGLVPADTPERDRVVARLKEILTADYGGYIVGEEIFVPQRHDRDIHGNVVVLPTGTFEEVYEKFRQFVIKNGRYPMLKAEPEEASLRKWYREVGHGLIAVSDSQKKQYYQLNSEFSGVKKTL